ncbi:MAG: glycosyltransferase [Endozoicomonas sp. (ex Botrylloides leachii)]|nr:glycosyltransferase [Endozoicomonas sp. (ex Botrylloides leachii)]
MHILLLPSWYPKTHDDISGVFFRDQAIALLNKQGHKVGVIAPQLRSLRTLFHKCDSTSSFKSFENDQGILTYRHEIFALLPRIPYGNYWLLKQAAKALLKRYIIENGKPDVLHAHAAIYGGAAGAELSEEFEIPLVLTEHSTGFARDLYQSWQLKLAERAMLGARSCIAVSPALGELLNKQFPKTKQQWKWIPNMVADRFNHQRDLKDNNRAVRFINLALMTKKKGQVDLIQAFSELIHHGMNAELWLAGDGPIRNELEQLAMALGIADSVRFLGLIDPDNVPKLLTEVDVMVISSHYETFGVVAAEALMAGLPVVATRCGGPECIVAQGDGLLVPPGQPYKLKEALFSVGSRLSEYNPVAIAERAKARFSAEAVAYQLTVEYKNILSPVTS